MGDYEIFLHVVSRVGGSYTMQLQAIVVGFPMLVLVDLVSTKFNQQENHTKAWRKGMARIVGGHGQQRESFDRGHTLYSDIKS